MGLWGTDRHRAVYPSSLNVELYHEIKSKLQPPELCPFPLRHGFSFTVYQAKWLKPDVTVPVSVPFSEVEYFHLLPDRNFACFLITRPLQSLFLLFPWSNGPTRARPTSTSRLPGHKPSLAILKDQLKAAFCIFFLPRCSGSRRHFPRAPG
jgi:hypothetical protein